MRVLINSDILVAGTENGYITVFDLSLKKQISATCLHRGSIEGLECAKDGLVVSCASDCTLLLHQLQTNKNKKQKQKQTQNTNNANNQTKL